jgi:hypothetical protein
MTQSAWEKYRLEEKILRILDIESYDPDHHFERPFLTAYQIAILFKNMYAETYARLNMPLGGKGTGIHHSLAQYLARMLSQHIKNDSLPNVEGRFLQMSNISHLEFDDFGESVEASSLSDLSMYRRTD